MALIKASISCTCVIESERSSGCSRDVKAFHDRHGTMMSGPNRNTFAIKYGANIVWMNTVYVNERILVLFFAVPTKFNPVT